MRSRFATFSVIRLLFTAAWLVLFFVGKPAAARALSQPIEPGAVLDGAAFVTAPVVYLIPETSTGLQLQVHTADFQVIDGQDGPLSLVHDGLYRINNSGEERATVPLLVVPEARDIVAEPTFTLTADGVPLALEVDESGYRAEVQIPPDSSVDVGIGYVTTLDDASSVQLRYDARQRTAWPGSPSLRVTLQLPKTIPPESWLNMTPDEWTYAAGGPGGVGPDERIGIQWLYDGAGPATPLDIRFLTPAGWRRISAFEAAKAGGDPAAYVALGEEYEALYLARPAVGSDGDEVDARTAERLYAQALAAYTAGLDHVTAETDPVAAGLLHAGLASLYRSRVLTPGRGIDADYTGLMIQAAAAGIALLPEGNARRDELTQWQADGLRQLLAHAQRRGDWPLVATLLDQMAALPEPPLPPEALAEERRVATVLQALALLEAGQREAAIAMAGEDIVDATLQPDENMQSLFSAWQITSTLSPAAIQLDVRGEAAAGRADAARQALQQQLAGWQSSPVGAKASVELEESPLPGGGAAFHLQISVDDRETAMTLAQSMASGPDWALLHAVLAQAGPLVRAENRFLQRTISMEQSLDLRAADNQWLSMAGNLAEQARAVEAQGRDINLSDPASIEAALLARIRAVNHRTASNVWRELGANSWVATRLTASDTGDGEARSWLAVTSSPAQTYTLQVERLHPTRVLAAAGVLLLLILLFSGLLWRLM